MTLLRSPKVHTSSPARTMRSTRTWCRISPGPQMPAGRMAHVYSLVPRPWPAAGAAEAIVKAWFCRLPAAMTGSLLVGSWNCCPPF